ncbi:bifunctional precorrin-2 dehydrogenase/sirohydrochlorin ferrochelatase [Thermoproteota archaeon]
MLIDILLEGQKVLVVGGGEIGERKSLQFLDAGAEITVISKEFTSKLTNLGAKKQIKLVKKIIKNNRLLSLFEFKPNIIIVALNDKDINKKIVEQARTMRTLICVVDNPSLSDFAMPAVAKVDDIRIAVSTMGRSPAMASIIRQRVEKMITRNDIRQIELQSYARDLAKKHILSPNERKRVLLGIIENSETNILLDNEKMDEARDLVKKIIIQEDRKS